MTQSISVASAKAIFSELINEVAFGHKRFVVVSRHRPKAALVSVEDLRHLEEQSHHSLSLKALKAADRWAHQVASHKRSMGSIAKDIRTIRLGRLR